MVPAESKGMTLIEQECAEMQTAGRTENGVEMPFEANHEMNGTKDGEDSDKVPRDEEVGKSAGKAMSKRKSFHMFPKKVKKTPATYNVSTKSSRGARIQRMTSLVIEDSESATNVLNDTSAKGDERETKASQSEDSSEKSKDQAVNLVPCETCNESKLESSPKAATSMLDPVLNEVAIPLQIPLVVKTASPITEEDSIVGETFSVMSALTEGKKQATNHHPIVALSKTQILEAADAGQPELVNMVVDLQDATQSSEKKIPSHKDEVVTSSVKSPHKDDDAYEATQDCNCHYETPSDHIVSPSTPSSDKVSAHEKSEPSDDEGIEVSDMTDTAPLAARSKQVCIMSEPHFENENKIKSVKSNEEPTMAVSTQSKDKKRRDTLGFFTKYVEKNTTSTDQEGSIDDEYWNHSPSPTVSKLRNLRKGRHALKKTKKQSGERSSRSSMSLGLSAKRLFSKTVMSKSKQELGDLDTSTKESVSTSPEDDSLCLSTSGSEEALENMTTFHFAFDGGHLLNKENTEVWQEFHAKGSSENEAEDWNTLRFDDAVEEDDITQDHDEQVDEAAEPSNTVGDSHTPSNKVPSHNIPSNSTPVKRDVNTPFANIFPSDFINFDDLASDVETQASFAVDKIKSLGDIDIDSYVDAESQLSVITDTVKAIGSCEGMNGSLQDDAKERIEALADQVTNLTSDGTCFDAIPANLCEEKCDQLNVCGDIFIDDCNACDPFESNKHRESTVDTPNGKGERYSNRITVVPTADELEGIIDLYLTDEENSIAASTDDDDDSLFSSLDEIVLRENPEQYRNPSDMNVLWEDIVM